METDGSRLSAADSRCSTLAPSGRHPRAVWLRAACVAMGLAAWFTTQAMIGHREVGGEGITDLVHRWSAPWHDYFFEHPHEADLLLVASSAVIDALGIFLILSAIFGRSLRPLLALLMLFALRQACQGLCSLPTPEGMIWRSPGVPSLLVTYGVATDLFFSGHTGLAVLGAIELARTGKPWLKWLGLAVAVFEAGTVLILHAHWTMDVYAGAVTAIVVSVAAQAWAPMCDGWLSRVAGTAPAKC
ncbi:MAG TPA: phosphatase PAP2-related protein [Pirellulales bacterium]